MLTWQFLPSPPLSKILHVSLNVSKQVRYLYIDVLCFKVKEWVFTFYYTESHEIALSINKNAEVSAIS